MISRWIYDCAALVQVITINAKNSELQCVEVPSMNGLTVVGMSFMVLASSKPRETGRLRSA